MDLFLNSPWIFLLGLFLLFMIGTGFFIVRQQSAVIIERFGKFARIAFPGLHLKIPGIERSAGHVNLRLTHLNVEIETKTRDDVFVKVTACVQYKVLPDKIFEAFYVLEHPEDQIQAFVFDVVRSRVPHIKLDDVFAKKDDIAISVRNELKEVMNQLGFEIINTLVTDINPDPKVKAAMNEINEAQRLRVAAHERGEAERILKVKQAQAEAESKILQGEGMAGQRKAIVDGLKESLSEFQSFFPSQSSEQALMLLFMPYYFDTLKDMAHHGKMNTIFLPYGPDGFKEWSTQIRDILLATHQVPQDQSHCGNIHLEKNPTDP